MWKFYFLKILFTSAVTSAIVIVPSPFMSPMSGSLNSSVDTSELL